MYQFQKIFLHNKIINFYLILLDKNVVCNLFLWSHIS